MITNQANIEQRCNGVKVIISTIGRRGPQGPPGEATRFFDSVQEAVNADPVVHDDEIFETPEGIWRRDSSLSSGAEFIRAFPATEQQIAEIGQSVDNLHNEVEVELAGIRADNASFQSDVNQDLQQITAEKQAFESEAQEIKDAVANMTTTGKIYDSLADAIAESPKPDDGTPFSVMGDGDNDGYWSFESGEPDGVKFRRKFDRRIQVESISQLRNYKGRLGEAVDVLGYYESGDGGGGLFYWDAASTEEDNGGTVIQATGIANGRWKRRYEGAINVKWFGAKIDGITDDSNSFNSALNFIKQEKGGELQWEGVMKINSPIYAEGISGLRLVGFGPEKSQLDLRDVSDPNPFQISYNPSNDVNYYVVGGLTKGQEFIPLSSTSGLNVGDFVWLRSNENLTEVQPTTLKWEILRIKSVDVNGIQCDGIINDYQSGYDIMVVKNTSNNNIHLEGFKTTGVESHDVVVGIGACDGVTCRNIVIDGGGLYGLRIGNWSNNVTVSDCNFRNILKDLNGYGVAFRFCQNVLASNNVGYNCRHTVETGESLFVDVINNKAVSNRGYGMSSHSGSQYVNFEGNQIINSYGGITSRGAFSKIVGNTGTGLTNTPINIGRFEDTNEREGLSGRNLLISGNTFVGTNTNNPFIFISNTLEDALIINNIFEGNTSNSMVLINNDSILSLEISGNVLNNKSGSSSDGININTGNRKISSELKDLSIINNKINCKRDPIRIVGPSNSDQRAGLVRIDNNILNTDYQYAINFNRFSETPTYYSDIVVVSNSGYAPSGVLNIDESQLSGSKTYWGNFDYLRLSNDQEYNTISDVVTVRNPINKKLGNVGAIKISLPVISTNTSISFRVDIYGNNSGESASFLISGYNSSTWDNTSAVMLSQSNVVPVRFGNDGTNSCVWIGNTNTVNFAYPVVSVIDFTGGGSNYIDSRWAKGWGIDLVNSFDTVDVVLEDVMPVADFEKLINKPSGVSGSFSTDGKTVTVVDGLITDIT